MQVGEGWIGRGYFPTIDDAVRMAYPGTRIDSNLPVTQKKCGTDAGATGSLLKSKRLKLSILSSAGVSFFSRKMVIAPWETDTMMTASLPRPV